MERTAILGESSRNGCEATAGLSKAKLESRQFKRSLGVCGRRLSYSRETYAIGVDSGFAYCGRDGPRLYLVVGVVGLFVAHPKA